MGVRQLRPLGGPVVVQILYFCVERRKLCVTLCRLLPLPRLLAAYLAGCSQCCGSIEAPKEIIPDPTGPANFIIEKAGFFTSTFKVKREVRELPRFMVA
jgi:hypothetical protein